MSYLLDTHILIWLLYDSDKLSKATVRKIESTNTKVYVSMASFFEIAIKKNLGKLDGNFDQKDIWEALEEMEILVLPIQPFHTITYEQLPIVATHKDPFDRLIIATAIAENLTLISNDKSLKQYEKLVAVKISL